MAAKIINPLEGLSRHHLLNNVDAFVAEKGLPDREVFRKGALIAQDPDNFENLADLDEDDKEVIRYERAHKWSHPLTLYVTIFLVRSTRSIPALPSPYPSHTVFHRRGYAGLGSDWLQRR